MSSRNSKILKDRLKNLEHVKHYREEIVTIDDKINKLESQIKNCKQDLVNFPSNLAIENKLIVMYKRLEELKNERDNN